MNDMQWHNIVKNIYVVRLKRSVGKIKIEKQSRSLKMAAKRVTKLNALFIKRLELGDINKRRDVFNY